MSCRDGSTGTFRLLAFGFIPLGAAASGFLLEHIGTVATVGAFAAVYLMFAVLTTVNRHVREARPLEQIAAEQKAA